MKDNINRISNSKEALAAFIECIKVHIERNKFTLPEAYEDGLLSSYNFAKGWYEEIIKDEYCTLEQYKNYFHGFILGDCSELPQYILCFLAHFYEGYDYTNLDNDVAIAIKEYLKFQLFLEAEKRKKIENLMQETKEIRDILKHQSVSFALKNIMPFIELEVAGKLGSKEVRGKTTLLIEVFNYGLILGKRSERAIKHKKDI